MTLGAVLDRGAGLAAAVRRLDCDQPRKGSILLVEDDPLVARAVARHLGRLGYEVTSVTKGGDAVAIYGRFTTVISDIELRDGCGVDFAERVRLAGRAPAFVFFSACRDASVLARAGAIGYVVEKSAGMQALGETLERVVSGGAG